MERRLRLLPKRKWATFAFFAFVSFIAGVIALYLFLLGMQAYSARQASMALNQLEALRIADPAASFDRAVSGFQSQDGVYILTAGAFRFQRLWDAVSKLPQDWALGLRFFSSRAGLRWWRLTAASSIQDGEIRAVSVGLMVDGRYETHGAIWGLAPNIPSLYGRWPLNEDEGRTHMEWLSITSEPGGKGFRISATDRSTEKELRARKINRGCLLSFRGCDGLCELLPNAVPVLQDRRRGWGGGTGAPRSHCDPK